VSTVGDRPGESRHPTSRHSAEIYDDIERTEQFQELRRRFRNFVFPMTALFLAWYLLYVVMSGWSRGFMAHKLLGHINVGYVFGLLQFLSTFLIAWAYARYAERRFDPLATRIRQQIEEEDR